MKVKNLVVIYPVLMSNLEGLCAFIKFFVNNLLFRLAVKVLTEIVQFLVKIRGIVLCLCSILLSAVTRFFQKFTNTLDNTSLTGHGSVQ